MQCYLHRLTHARSRLSCDIGWKPIEDECLVTPQVISLAQCNGAAVEAMPYGSFSQEEFRQIVADVCSQSEKFLIVSYSRQSVSTDAPPRPCVELCIHSCFMCGCQMTLIT